MKLRTDLQAVAACAGLFATTHGHATITAEHLLAALLTDETVKQIIAGVGGDVLALVSVTNRLLDSLDPRLQSAGFSPPVSAIDVLKRALLAVTETGARELTPIDAFVALYGPPASRASQLLTSSGIERMRVLHFIEHGIAHDEDPSDVTPDTLPARDVTPSTAVNAARKIVLHNDRYTTMEFIVEALQSFFDLGADDARRLMLAVHREGKATVAVDAEAIAERRIATFLSHARAHGMPLLVTSEPA